TTHDHPSADRVWDRVREKLPIISRAAKRLRPCAGVRRGELDDELRAFARAFAVRGDASAVHLDDVADDREPEAQAAVCARARRFRLTESLEDMRQKARIDSLPGVGDCDLRRVADATEADR